MVRNGKVAGRGKRSWEQSKEAAGNLAGGPTENLYGFSGASSLVKIKGSQPAVGLYKRTAASPEDDKGKSAQNDRSHDKETAASL